VTSLPRHLRSPLIAAVALAMSVGMAYAAHPAADRQSHAINQANPSETSEPDESEAPEATESDASGDSSTDAGTNCTTDPTTLTPDQLAAMSHGSIVCWAAQQETPEGWDNHGAWVSHWAKMNHGADASSNGKTNSSAGKSKGHAHQS